MSHSIGKQRKVISLQMISFELRNVIGNPFIHIFGVGFPIFMGQLLPRAMKSEFKDPAIYRNVCTSMYLGMGMLIPLATILMGYSISYAQEQEKGIPQRMELFGIKNSVSLINRAIAEGIYMLIAFALYFTIGVLFQSLEAPVTSGVLLYALCMFLLSIISLALGHSIACICKKFGPTYCVSMLSFFGMMILSGMMGISYEKLPKAAQAVAKLLPITYINKDFLTIWTGKQYNFGPMIQSFLFFAAFSFILFFIALKTHKRA